MTTAEYETEIARLRRELEYAIEAARENGKERDELARQLGEEVARSQGFKAALVVLEKKGEYETCIICGRGMESTVYDHEPHHHTCVIGNAIAGSDAK